jgi:hypothetical protein
MNAPAPEPSLNTDLAAALAELDQVPRPGATQFALPANLLHVRLAKARDRADRRGVRRLIRPENAAGVLAALPSHPDDRTHCILRGDFVLCDLIPAICAQVGPLGHVRIATLGLSTANAQQLVSLVESGRIHRLTIVASHYFAQVDRTTTFAEVNALLDRIGTRLIIGRNHAKVILLPPAAAGSFALPLILEGSANLRSSDNLEQLAIFADSDLHDFHAAWIDLLAAAATHG